MIATSSGRSLFIQSWLSCDLILNQLPICTPCAPSTSSKQGRLTYFLPRAVTYFGFGSTYEGSWSFQLSPDLPILYNCLIEQLFCALFAVFEIFSCSWELNYSWWWINLTLLWLNFKERTTHRGLSKFNYIWKEKKCGGVFPDLILNQSRMRKRSHLGQRSQNQNMEHYVNYKTVLWLIIIIFT